MRYLEVRKTFVARETFLTSRHLTVLLLGSGGPQKDARRKNKHNWDHNCSARPENSSYKDLTRYPTKDIHLQRTVGT